MTETEILMATETGATVPAPPAVYVVRLTLVSDISDPTALEQLLKAAKSTWGFRCTEVSANGAWVEAPDSDDKILF